MDLRTHFPSHITTTGHELDLTGFSDTWRRRVVELGEAIRARYEESGKDRYITAFGGASGSGKSTTVAVLEHILRASGLPAVHLGQDGYHHAQAYLEATLDAEGEPLSAHKGREDSFDVPAMESDLERFKEGESIAFPEYSRVVHDPVADAVKVDGPALLLFEGLWLLYDNAPWNELLPLYDLTVFFHAEPDVRKERTIMRHVRGHEHAPADAERFYETSDAVNGERIMNTVAPHDIDFYS